MATTKSIVPLQLNSYKMCFKFTDKWTKVLDIASCHSQWLHFLLAHETDAEQVYEVSMWCSNINIENNNP